VVGDRDGGHQGDPRRPGAERVEHVPDAAVVHRLSPGPPAAGCALGEHDRVDPSTAAASVSGRVRSPTITSAAVGSRRTRAGVRTRARTRWPWSRASAANRRPMLPMAPTTRTVRGRSWCGHLVDGAEAVEGAGVADERQQLSQHHQLTPLHQLSDASGPPALSAREGRVRS
jgi:hypothetical protein